MHHAAFTYALSCILLQKVHRLGMSEAFSTNLLSERIGVIEDGPQSTRTEALRLGLHTHPHYEMLLIVKGTRCIWHSGHEDKASAGDLVVFPPGLCHCEFMGSARISYFVLRFHPDELQIQGLKGLEDLTSGLITPLSNLREFIRLFHCMAQEYGSNAPDRDVLLSAYLIEFVVRLRRSLGDEAKEPHNPLERIASVMDHLGEDLAGRAKLEQLAQQAFMSPSHFSREFKKVSGQSPGQFKIHALIEEAKYLLTSTDRSAVEISEQLGYTSPFFFYRQFKAKTGLTTREYRARAKA